MSKKVDSTKEANPKTANIISNLLDNNAVLIEFVGGVLSSLLIFRAKDGQLSNMFDMVAVMQDAVDFKTKLGKGFANEIMEKLWETILVEFSIRSGENIPQEIAEQLLKADQGAELSKEAIKEVVKKFALEASSKEVAQQLEGDKKLVQLKEKLTKSILDKDNEGVHGYYDDLMRYRLMQLDPEFVKALDKDVAGIDFWYA